MRKHKSIAKGLTIAGHKISGKQKKVRRPTEDHTSEDAHYDFKSTRASNYLEPHDYLSPLYRFLESRVSTSWDKVYSDLLGEEGREVHRTHIKQHLKGYVEQNPYYLDGQYYAKDWRRYLYQPSFGFYVDIRGILRAWPKRKEHKAKPDQYQVTINKLTIYKLKDGRMFTQLPIENNPAPINSSKLITRRQKGDPWEFRSQAYKDGEYHLGPFEAYYGEWPGAK